MRPRVVLAEDHPTVAEELRTLLATEYDVVHVVHDGQALIEVVRSQMPDVIVSDIAMPGMSGLRALRTVRAEHNTARVVLITIRTEPELITYALTLGALGYVLKSDAGEELLAAVGACLEGEQYLSTGARALLERK